MICHRGQRLLFCVTVWSSCNDGTVLIGSFETADGAVADSLSCQPYSKTSPLPETLPVDETTVAEGLPPGLWLGPALARKSVVETFETDPRWGHGRGAYSASLAEFGEAGHVPEGGRHTLRIVAKTDPASGITDRKYWGAELTSPTTFGHGLFLARIRVDGWQDVHSAFFIASDRIAPDGANLGWTGAVLEFTHDGNVQRLSSLWNDSASGQHDYKFIRADAPSQKEWLLAVVNLPGRVAFYVDGERVDERQDADPLAIVGFHFTHWINDPAPRVYTPSPLPIDFSIDFVAHYAVDVCP